MTWKPYDGLRVLDLSQGFAGPACTAMLAAGGAEVIKVEPPAGDWARLMGRSHEGHTALTMVGNVGKRAICIDASRPEGVAIIHRMARRTDIVVESFRPGVADKLGVGADRILADNDRVIYLSISGFGADGPYARRAGSDSIMQAYTGIMVMNRDDEGSPRRIGMFVVDALAGSYAAHVLGAALYHRARTGKGGRYAMSLLEVCAAFQAVPIVDTILHGETRRAVSVPAGTFATADGALNLVAIRNDMFFAICRAIGREDWLSDPRFTTNESRNEHSAEINATIAETLARAPNAHWERVFAENDVLCSAVNDYPRFVADAQVRHARIFTPVEQPPAGPVPIPRVPGLPPAEDGPRPSPALGEHSREILLEHGYTAEEVARLSAQGVVVQAAKR